MDTWLAGCHCMSCEDGLGDGVPFFPDNRVPAGSRRGVHGGVIITSLKRSSDGGIRG